MLLDEVADLPLALQAKLLRVIERGRIRPLGGAEEHDVDVRYILSTNRDLKALVEEGSFRHDLYYRINALEIAVPPLRERLEDLPVLVEHFRLLARGEEDENPVFEAGALEAMARYSWPGNIRELVNVVTHLVLTHSHSVGSEEVERLLRQAPASGVFSASFLRSRPLAQLRRQLEKEYLAQLLADADGEMKTAAAELGISLQALYRRLAAAGLRPKDFR